MKAIIFGVTGQDGSHLADLLLEKNYQVIGISRRTSTDNTGRIKHLLDNEVEEGFYTADDDAVFDYEFIEGTNTPKKKYTYHFISSRLFC